MKRILMITVILSVIAVAVFGCLMIFEVISAETAISSLTKIVGAFVLLGGCTALISFVLRSNKSPPD